MLDFIVRVALLAGSLFCLCNMALELKKVYLVIWKKTIQVRKIEIRLPQRQLLQKEKRSNYYKTKKKIALCHEKIRNTRKDYLYKNSHEIVSENQVIVSENLQVKNHHLAKSIRDVSW